MYNRNYSETNIISISNVSTVVAAAGAEEAVAVVAVDDSRSIVWFHDRALRRLFWHFDIVIIAN